MPPTPFQPGISTLRDRALILLAAFVIILPLLLRGASCGHDLDFHMTNWMEVAEQWRHGILWPHWAFTPAWGAGEPRFVFYPPLSWLLGGILAMLMPIRFVPAAFTFIALAACGLSMRRLAAEWTAPPCALLAAVFFMANPYMLFCAYERCAYGELLAAAWMPLLLLAILRTPISLRGIALPVALLWLTNAPSAVMSCYLFAVIALLRVLSIARNAFTGRRLRSIAPFALRAVGGMALGIGLAAFYIVPASWQRRWVQIDLAIAPPARVQDSTLFHHTTDPFHDAVLLTASWIAVVMLSLAAALLLAAWQRRAEIRLVTLLGGAIACIGLALTPISLFAWQHLPQLRFIQFPWRLLALLGVLLSLLLALATRHRNRTLLLAALLLPMIVVPPAYRQFSSRCFDEDVPATQFANFRAGDGVDATDEYTPRTADNDTLLDDINFYWLTNDPRSLSLHPATQNGSIDFSLAQSFHIPAAHPPLFILRLRNYPAWQVRVNGTPAHILPRADGLLVIALPPGEADITVSYRLLPDELIGALISLLALLLFFLLRRRARHRGMNALTIPIDPSSPFIPAALPT
jgi:Ca2+/Na+ antiporter